MKRITFHDDGTISSQSIEIELKNWYPLYLEYLESQGINPKDCIFKMPDGELAFVSKNKDDEWHWEIG